MDHPIPFVIGLSLKNTSTYVELHPEELLFLKEIDHNPSDQVLEEDYQKLYALLKIS